MPFSFGTFFIKAKPFSRAGSRFLLESLGELESLHTPTSLSPQPPSYTNKKMLKHCALAFFCFRSPLPILRVQALGRVGSRREAVYRFIINIWLPAFLMSFMFRRWFSVAPFMLRTALLFSALALPCSSDWSIMPLASVV